MRVEGRVPRLLSCVGWPGATRPETFQQVRSMLRPPQRDTCVPRCLPATRTGRRRLWVVLWHSQRIMVSGWKIGLKVTLDVMLHSKLLAKFNHSQCVILPVNALAVLTEVVGLTHLEEVYEAMGSPDTVSYTHLTLPTIYSV